MEAKRTNSPPHRKQLRALMEANDEAKGGVPGGHRGACVPSRAQDLGRTLKPLIESGFVVSSGQTRGRRYTITQKGQGSPVSNSPPTYLNSPPTR